MPDTSETVRPKGLTYIGYAYAMAGVLTILTGTIWFALEGMRPNASVPPILSALLGMMLLIVGHGLLEGDKVAKNLAVAVAIGAIGQPIFGLGRMIAEMEWETFIGVIVPMTVIMAANVAVLNYLLGDGAKDYFQA
jgi:hypothetical protein